MLAMRPEGVSCLLLRDMETKAQRDGVNCLNLALSAVTLYTPLLGAAKGSGWGRLGLKMGAKWPWVETRAPRWKQVQEEGVGCGQVKGQNERIPQRQGRGQHEGKRGREGCRALGLCIPEVPTTHPALCSALGSGLLTWG